MPKSGILIKKIGDESIHLDDGYLGTGIDFWLTGFKKEELKGGRKTDYPGLLDEKEEAP